MRPTPLALALSLALAGLSAPGFAQLGSPFGPVDAFDTLSSAPVGDGAAFGGALDRARGAVASTQASPFGAPAASPFGAPAASPFGGGGDPFGGGAPSPFGGAPSPFGNVAGFTAAAGPIPLNPVQEATLSAWGGTRVICRRTGAILEDGREINILVSQVGSYFDDGRQGGDAVAGDNIYTNIVIDNDHISPEAHLVKTRMVQTLQYASMLTPMQFNLTPVATTETSSSRATGWRLSRNGLNGITIELVSSRVLQGGTTDPTEAEQAMVEAVGPNLLRFRGERGTFGPPTRVMFGQTTLVMDGNDPGRYIRVTRTGSAPLSGSIAIFPLQPIPQVVDLEMEQDKRLMEWITLRLRDFRQDPDELASGFHPTYLPPPPRAPNKPLPATFTDQQLPAGFNPNVPGAPGGGGVGNFDIDRGVTGEPIGNASSRYF